VQIHLCLTALLVYLRICFLNSWFPQPSSPLQVRSVALLIAQGAAVGTSEVEELVPHEGWWPLSLKAAQVEEALTLVTLHWQPLIFWLHCFSTVPTLHRHM